ncbi:D-Ala-D-Ala carboxypeptidase family metallohydrolase [Burkholderiaceae bacterium UC74_6]
MTKTALLLAPLLLLASCASNPPAAPAPAPNADGEIRTEQSFAEWRARTNAPLAAFAAQLDARGLAEQVPLHELLRSASDWAKCNAEPYALPPEAQWPEVYSVLTLLKTMRAQGVLGRVVVYSGYRDETLNACAGGAKGSAHLRSFAIDFRPVATPAESDETDQRLCRFWQTQGQALHMGLSRYPSGRIHIDTHGWRTWGADHTQTTAFCTKPAQP